MKRFILLFTVFLVSVFVSAQEEDTAGAMPVISRADPENILMAAEKFELRAERYSAQMEYEAALEKVVADIAAEREPEYNSALAEFIIEKIVEISDFTCENQEANDLLEKTFAGKKMIPFLQRRLNSALLTLSMRLGNAAKAKKIAQNLGVIRDWFFYTQSLSGKPEISEGIYRKVNSPDGVVNPKVFLNTTGKELLGVALINNTSTSSQRIMLGIESTVSFKAFVDGIEVASDASGRDMLTEVKVVAFDLRPGRSVLELRFNADNDMDRRFRCWLVGSLGAVSDKIEFITGGKEISTQIEKFAAESSPLIARGVKVTTVDPGATRIFASKVKINIKDSRSAYYLGYLLSRRQLLGRHATAAGQMLMQAAKQNADSGIYFLTLARIDNQQSRARADRDENMRRLSLLKVISIMPESVSAYTDLARYYMDSVGSLEKANYYIKKALENNPQSVEANLALADLYRKRGWGARAYKLLLDLGKRNPLVGQLRLFEGEMALQFSQAGVAIEGLESAYNADYTNFGAFTRYSAQLYSMGQIPLWQSVITKHLELFPYDLHPRVELADYYLNNMEYSKLQAELEQLAQINENNAEYLKLAGDFAQLEGREDEAIDFYKKALSVDTADVSLRDFLAYKGAADPSPLTEIASIADYAQGFDYFKPQPGDELVYLLDEEVAEIYADSTKSRSYYSVIRVLDEAGAQKMRRFPVWYDGESEQVKVELSRVMHNDGSSSTAQVVPVARPGEKQVVLVMFPALVKGDIVELKYTISQVKPDFFGDYFGDIHMFRKFDPVLRGRYVLISPKKRELYFHLLNGAPEPKTTTEDGRVVRAWQMENLEALAAEPFMPRLTALSPVVQVSTFKDWDALARWYWNLIKDQNITNTDISDKVRELTASSKNDNEKLSAIYNWVINNVRNNAWEFGVHGYKPYNAGAIFTRRFGDCKDKATLINVMAREAGIESWPLLLRSVDPSEPASGRTEEDLTLPLLSHFNHCISVADIGGKKYYLDGTMQFQTLESLPFTDTGAEAVVVRPGGAERVSLPAHTPLTNSWLGTTTMKIAEDGNTDFEFGFSGTGQVSVFLRSWFRNPQSWDNVLKAIATQKLGSVMAVVVDDVVVDGLANAAASLQGRVRIKEYAKKEGAKMVFTIPEVLLSGTFGKDGALPDKMMHFAQNSTRASALVLPSLFSISRQIRIEWADGLELAEKFEDRAFNSDFGELKVKYTITANILEIDYLMQTTKMVIPPSEYPEFRRFCQMVDRINAYIYTLEEK